MTIAPSSLARLASIPTLAAALMLSACGAEFIKPGTPEEIQASPDVISYTKERYTSFRHSAGLSEWWEGSGEGVHVATFRIVTNRQAWIDDQAAFEADMTNYCQTKGGRFDSRWNRGMAPVEAALSANVNDQAALQFLRHRAGNPATFTCTLSPGEYLFYGEAIYKRTSKDSVAIRTRLNQGPGGTPLRTAGVPSVR